MNDDLCHCGKPLHYNFDEARKHMNDLVKLMGRFIDITIDERTWKVDRHYIALHGIKAEEMDKYGFEEIINGNNK